MSDTYCGDNYELSAGQDKNKPGSQKKLLARSHYTAKQASAAQSISAAQSPYHSRLIPL